MAGQAGTPHILVCDDDPAIRDVFQTALELEGYRVTTWAAPCEDPEEVAALAPDLIVLDLVFRGDTAGVAFLERLQANARTQGIPVLLCTASAQPVVLPLGVAPAATITKPFDLDDLLQTVCRCLNSSGRNA
jgi:CheY-like chemotaxis protein